MRSRRAGFTLIEIAVALIVGAILTSIAVKALGSTSTGLAVRQARNVFVGMAARARAQAIESGMPTLLLASTTGDSVMILAGGRIVETVRFSKDLEVDIQASSPSIRLCMGPRGYANPSCNSFQSTIKMVFAAGSETETVEILPMGQIRW